MVIKSKNNFSIEHKNRRSQKDVNQELKTDTKPQSKEEVGYTNLNGICDPLNVVNVELPVVKISDNKCYIKVVTTKSKKDLKVKYYIKAGGSSGSLYNPWGLYTEGSENLVAVIKGKKMWNFVEVSEFVYDLYVRFLKTRNAVWYRNADREYKNG